MEIKKDGPGWYDIENIGCSSLDKIYIQRGRAGVWLDTYTPVNENPEYYSARDQMTTFGWLSPDDAEALGLALIDAAQEARRIREPDRREEY